MVELIRTIPGAGLITAATVRAYTDDIKRFPSYKQYSARSASRENLDNRSGQGSR